MREFINDFGKDNFTIIAIVVLVILVALVVIILFEKLKLKKAIKKNAKKAYKSINNLTKAKPQENKNEQLKKVNKEKTNIAKNRYNLINEKNLDALKSIKKMEDTINSSYIKQKPIVPSHKKESVKEESIQPVLRPTVKEEKIKKKPTPSYDYNNLNYNNEKPFRDEEVVYKKSTNSREEAKEKLNEVTKKLVEEKSDNHITVFEEEQEEKSIISYEELVKASHNIDEKNDKLLEDEMEAAITLDELYNSKKKKEEVKAPVVTKEKVYQSNYISPVYGRVNNITTKEKYDSFKDEDSDAFLENLRKFRNKLD